MVKHNKAIDCNQFRKDIHPLIRTWLNQPARKLRRRQAREAKIAQNRGLTPINYLRPIVNGHGQKYNDKLRAGRGFTLEELKAAGLHAQAARSIRIAVDMRRTNKNAVCFARNVERLKDYLSRVTVLSESKKLKKSQGGIPQEVSMTDAMVDSGVVRINNKVTRNRSVLVQ